MANTITGAVVSLDGYVTDINGDVGSLFDWYGNGDVEWKWTERQEHPRRTTAASWDFVQAVYPQIGAVVIGRRLFDQTNGWGGVPAAGDYVFVVTHAPSTDWEFADTAPFTFVRDGVAAAIDQAHEFAANRDVDVAAGRSAGKRCVWA